MNMQNWLLLWSSLAVILINVFVKTWVLSLVVVAFLIMVILDIHENSWLQYGLIGIAVWQAIIGINKMFEEIG